VYLLLIASLRRLRQLVSLSLGIAVIRCGELFFQRGYFFLRRGRSLKHKREGMMSVSRALARALAIWRAPARWEPHSRFLIALPLSPSTVSTPLPPPPPPAAAAAAELGMRRVKLKVLELRSRAERERSLRDREECEVVLYLH